MTAAILATPTNLFRPLMAPGYLGQTGDVCDLILVGLTNADNQDQRNAVFAEEIPSIQNGLWTVAPDGRMEITWHIRPGSAWHDGTPFTADDLVFTHSLSQDRDLPEFRATASGLVDSVEAVDPRTLKATFKTTYIYGDRMFTTGADGFATPVPKHLLEAAYRDAKDTFRQLPYWGAEYVGNGPYRVKEFVADEHVMLEAFDGFVLGRPKIDTIDVRFIPDPNTMTANILSNAVDVTLGANLSLDQSVDVRDQWRDGRMELTFASWIVIYPQFINPNPAVVSDVRFRRALLMGIDRQAMADTIQKGLVPVAHSYLTPTDPEYAETESAIVKYDYDPQRAEQLLNEIGYARGGDGVMRDAQGQVLHLEVRTTASPAIHGKTFYPMVDFWERLGLDIDPVVIPVQRLTDLEYRTQQPTFEVVRYPNGVVNLWRVHSDATPLPSNKFTGHNRSRYMNPEFDAMIDRYNATIPWEPRMQALRQVITHMTTVLNVMGLFYDTKTIMVSNRMSPNVLAENTSWNGKDWTMK